MNRATNPISVTTAARLLAAAGAAPRSCAPRSSWSCECDPAVGLVHGVISDLVYGHVTEALT